MSVNGPTKLPFAKKAMYWYTGDDAVTEGTALVFDTDTGTAANVDCSRNNHVEKSAAASKNLDFAGVAANNYFASKGGQFIEVNLPGSRGVKIQLASAVSATINTGVLNFGDAGKFVVDGDGTNYGRGAAIPRQTVTAGQKCQVDLLEGDQPWS